MTEETTLMYPFKFRSRFRYFDFGHTCGIKVKKENRDRRIMCNCSVDWSVHGFRPGSFRVVRSWWKPFYWLGTIEWIRYSFLYLYIRKYVTCD